MEAPAPAAAEPPVVLDWLLVLPLDDMPELDLSDCAEVLGVAAEPLGCEPLELCAYAAPESASRAEAVALTRIFNVM